MTVFHLFSTKNKNLWVNQAVSFSEKKPPYDAWLCKNIHESSFDSDSHAKTAKQPAIEPRLYKILGRKSKERVKWLCFGWESNSAMFISPVCVLARKEVNRTIPFYTSYHSQPLI